VVAFFEPACTLAMLGRRHTAIETVEDGHGRTERRCVFTSDKVECLSEAEKWPRLASITMVESERTVDGKTTLERRYYISSKVASARVMSKLVRGHWSVENDCHWTLDVAFR